MPDLTVDAETLRDYAPTGRLRVALNHGNRILVGRDADGTARGITVDLAQALAGTLGLQLDFVHYDRAGDVSGSATSGDWDICFLAVDPARAEVLEFTAPYVQIEGGYLAAPDCTVADAPALVASGLPVATVTGSAYTLTLERTEGAKALVHFPTFAAALDALDSGAVAAMAGIGAVMVREAALRPGARVLAPPFMQIRQAMAIVRGRPTAAAHLHRFIAAMKQSGAIGDILEDHGVDRSAAVISG